MPLNTFNRSHLTIPHDFFTSESSAIYVSSILRTFGLSLIGVFLPIYLFGLQLPYVFNDNNFTNSIFIICIFFFLESFFAVLTLFIFSRWVYKNIPFQKILLFSNLVLIGGLLGLYNLEKIPILYFITPVALGLVITCYWVPYHLFFIEKNGDKNGHYGKKLGISSFFIGAVTALWPLVGGVILILLGFKGLFLIASILIFLSSIPILFEIRDVRHHIEPALGIVSKYLLNKQYYFVSVGFLGATIVFAVFNLFWPIVLMFTLRDFSEIGILTFFSIFLYAMLSLIVGKLVDGKGNKKMYVWGTIIASVSHLIRVFVNVPLHIYSLDIFSRTSSLFTELPFVAKTYEIARGKDSADFVIYREIALHFFRLVVLILIMILFVFLPEWKYIFILASIGSVLAFLISLQKSN